MVGSSKTELSGHPGEVIQEEKGEVNPHSLTTPFEEMLLSGSTSLIINGESKYYNTNSLKKLLEDPITRKAALSPHGVTAGEMTLEESLKGREGVKYFPAFLILFELGSLYSHVPKNKDIETVFRLGTFENGELTKFEYGPSEHEDRISLSDIPSGDLVINKDFEQVVELVSRENSVLKFRIKSQEEIQKSLGK